MKAPVVSVSEERSVFSSTLCRTICAPGIAAPLASCTLPLTLPNVDCAVATNGVKKKQMAEASKIMRLALLCDRRADALDSVTWADRAETFRSSLWDSRIFGMWVRKPLNTFMLNHLNLPEKTGTFSESRIPLARH